MLPDGKLIYYNQNMYYNNKQIGTSNIFTYNISIPNWTINGSEDTHSILPIAYHPTKILEFIDIVLVTSYYSNRNIIFEYSNGDSLCSMSVGNGTYQRQYMIYSSLKEYHPSITTNITNTIRVYDNSGYHASYQYNIIYTCYYL